MASSDFWRELALNFKSVPDFYEFSASRQYYMELQYFLPTSRTEPDWELHPIPPALAEFRAMAVRGATMLPPLPTNDLTVRWLEALWKEATEGPVRSGIPIVGKDRTGRLTELRGTIPRAFESSSTLCRKFETEALQAEFEEKQRNDLRNRSLLPAAGASPPESQRYEHCGIVQTSANVRPDPKALRDSYLANFPDEKIRIRDLCWAAGQHYREWKRWLAGELKDGSTPDLAFRRILVSGKRPLEFNKKQRPDGWE